MRIAFTILLLLNVAVGQTVNDLRPTVTMKEYVDMQNQFIKEMAQLNTDWQQKYNVAQLTALKESSELTRLALLEYKTVNNEWRGQLKDQAGTFVTWQALIGLIFGLAGLIFGYANFKKNQEVSKSSGSVIRSGDNVEVKK